MPEATEPATGDLAAYDRLKRELLRGLAGRVLEIGAGRGANFGLLPPGIDWVGVEPSKRRRRQLEDRLRVERRLHPSLGDREAAAGVAESLPLADASVDAVLSTITLCSVRDQERALAEVLRVLRPGGRFVFFEHVGAPSRTWRWRAERWVAPVNRLVDHGCDPSRETWRAIGSAGFSSLDLRWFRRGSGRLIGGQAIR